MKSLSRRLLLALAAILVLVAAAQFQRQRALERKRLERDLVQAGRLLLAAEGRNQDDFWQAHRRELAASARLLLRELAAAANEPGPEAAPVPAGEEAARLAAAPPADAAATAAALRRLHEDAGPGPSPIAGRFFISRDRWRVAFPAGSAGQPPPRLQADDERLLRDAAPARNPGHAALFSAPRRDAGLDRWVISAVQPVFQEGAFLGVIGHDIEAEPLRIRLAAGPGAPAASLFFMDDAFRVVLHRDPAPGAGEADGIADPLDRQAAVVLARERAFPAERLLRLGGETAALLSARQEDTGWHLVLTLRSSAWLAGGGAARPFLTHALPPLAAGLLLLFLFLRTALLAPLSRLAGSLQARPDPASRPARRARIFPEIDRLRSGIEAAMEKLRGQAAAGRESGTLLEALLRTVPALIVVLDARLRPTYINEAGRLRFQVSPEAVPALRAADFFDRGFRRQVLAELKENDHFAERETTLTLRSGEKIDVSLSLSRLRDAQGRASGFLAVISDISKRRKAELDLKNQILFSRQIFQSIPEMILIVDRRLRVTFINQRTRDLVQAGRASIIGQNLNSILARNSIESGFDELVRSVLEGGGSVHRINTLNPVLEEENYVDLIVEPLKSGGHVIGGIIMLRDIAEWRSLTSQLRSLQGFLQKLINASPYAVISLNEHGLITTWNSAAERILGVPFTAAFGKNLFALLPLFEKYRDAINEVMILRKTHYLNDEQVFIGEEDFKVANFTFYPVTAEPSGVVIHMEDVSALKQLESSLIHAQKMESLGLLTSHIIHDFNNLLSGIMGYASLLEKKIADNPKLLKYVSTIITSSERASTLISQLLNYSRKKMAEKEVLNVNDLIKESLDFLAMNLKSINLDIQLYHSQILLQADKTKISQILINLIVNARDALEGAARPILRLRTDRVEISEQSDLLDGQYALIEISDNGGGISPENQKKIFEPFFTTKGQGRGTGLGLAIVREIIRDYNGRIELRSQTGQGTTFTILLPVFEKAPQEQALPRAETVAEAPLEGLVLLIDDEEVVREIGADMLKTMGLQCLTAVDGSEGIELFRKHAGEIALGILDVEMPGISGEKVYQQLREESPGVKILIASGYGRDYLESEVFKAKIPHFMPKPFKTEQLSYQVTKLLRGGDV